MPRPLVRRSAFAAMLGAAGGFAWSCSASARESFPAAAVAPLPSQPTPRVVIDDPAPAQLRNGRIELARRH